MIDITPRWQTKNLKTALQTRRVLLVSGARQCGKTTLVKQLLSDDVLYQSLDDQALRQLANNDPKGFISHHVQLHIIDEIQRSPELLSTIKLMVDEDTRPGQFLLTGSANLQSLPTVQESLAGRLRKLRLRAFTQGELVGAQPTFLQNAFNQNFSQQKSPYNRHDLLHIAFRGGFPEAIKLPEAERSHWHKDYLSALLERDLADIARITQYSAMRKLVHTLAAWSGKLMDLSAIGTGLAIKRPTIETYINALETLYLVERVYPWTDTDYERVGKQDKLYMTDCGQMAAILNWNFNKVELDGDRSGKMLETFIFNEIAALVDVSSGEYELFHYRDREKREIDFLIERNDEALLGIEVKAGSAISTNDFKHLSWFQQNIAKNRPFTGIVLYTGEYAGSMGNNLFAVPFGALWE